MTKETQNPQLNIPVVSCSVVHCKKSPYDVYIGRPSKWGNPFTHKQDGKTLAKHIVGSRDEAVEAYREWITNGEGKHLMNDWQITRAVIILRNYDKLHITFESQHTTSADIFSDCKSHVAGFMQPFTE